MISDPRYFVGSDEISKIRQNFEDPTNTMSDPTKYRRSDKHDVGSDKISKSLRLFCRIGCSGQVHRRTGAQAHRRIGAQASRRTGAQAHRRIGVQAHRCTQAHRRPGAQAPMRIGAQAHPRLHHSSEPDCPSTAVATFVFPKPLCVWVSFSTPLPRSDFPPHPRILQL